MDSNDSERRNGPGDRPNGGYGRRMRASDADRAATADRLRQHYTEGRLDAQEYDERIERCYAAKTVDELDELFMDLPRAHRANPGSNGATVSWRAATVAIRGDRGGHRRAHHRLVRDGRASLLAGVAALLPRLRAVRPLAPDGLRTGRATEATTSV